MVARLSNELLLLIFEMAIQREEKLEEPQWYIKMKNHQISTVNVDYKQILKLLCVHRPIHGRLLELLYERVVIKYQRQMNAFLELIQPKKRKYRVTVDWAALVRSLVIANDLIPPDDLDPLLAALRHLQVFATISSSPLEYCNQSRMGIDQLRMPFAKNLHFFQSPAVNKTFKNNAIKPGENASTLEADQTLGKGYDVLTLIEMTSVPWADDEGATLLELIGPIWQAASYRYFEAASFPYQSCLHKVQLCGSTDLLQYFPKIFESNPQITHLRLVYSCERLSQLNQPISRAYLDIDWHFEDELRIVSFENLIFEGSDIFGLLPRRIESIEIRNCCSEDFTTDNIGDVLKSENGQSGFPELRSLLISSNSIDSDEYIAAEDLDENNCFWEFDEMAEEFADDWVDTAFGECSEHYIGPSVRGMSSCFLRPYVDSAGFVRPETRDRLFLKTGANVSDEAVAAVVSGLVCVDCQQFYFDRRAQGIRDVKRIMHLKGIDGGIDPCWAFSGPAPYIEKAKQMKITDYFSPKSL